MTAVVNSSLKLRLMWFATVGFIRFLAHPILFNRHNLSVNYLFRDEAFNIASCFLFNTQVFFIFLKKIIVNFFVIIITIINL